MSSHPYSLDCIECGTCYLARSVKPGGYKCPECNAQMLIMKRMVFFTATGRKDMWRGIGYGTEFELSAASRPEIEGTSREAIEAMATASIGKRNWNDG